MNEMGLKYRMQDIRNIREINESKDSQHVQFRIGDLVGSYFGGGTLVGNILRIETDGLVVCSNVIKGGNDIRRFPADLYLIRRGKPMFKTDDGVMLNEGDIFYWVTDDGYLIERCAAPSNDTPLYKQFASKERAEKYIKSMFLESSLNKKFTGPVKKNFFQRLFNIK